MSFDAHKNLAFSTVTTAPTPATSGTSLIVTSSSTFPAVPFNATIWPVNVQPTTSNAEIVRVTAIASNTFTITRAQESSTARAIIVGDQIAATITAKTFTDIEAGGIGVTSQAANDLLYASSATQLARIANAASSVLATNASSVPALTQTLPTAVQDLITRLGTIVAGVWNGTAITVANGGTGLTTFTTAYGVIAAGTTATGALQNCGAGTAGQVLTSNGASTLPSFQAIHEDASHIIAMQVFS